MHNQYSVPTQYCQNAFAFHECALYLIYFILISTDEGFGSFCDTFSFIDSMKSLLQFDKDNELNSFYGCKVIMMINVIMIHKLSIMFGNPTSNPKFLESVSHKNIIETKLPIGVPFAKCDIGLNRRQFEL